MYLYELYGFELSIVLTHDKKFTNEEFRDMCEETPKQYIDGEEYIDAFDIEKYLINNYGFKEVDYTSKFFLNYD